MSDSLTPTVESSWAPGTEHICLESDEIVVDRRLGGAKVGPTLTISSPMRGCETEIALLDDHRLAVRTRRRRTERQYLVDLRFVDLSPQTVRHVAWGFWLASIALGAGAACLHWPQALPAGFAWPQQPWPVTLGLVAAALVLALLAAYRTCETLQFRSVHGRTPLVELTGNIGCSRSSAEFSASVGRRILDARSQMAQSRQQFLRDELREHRRLFEEGALAAEAYEAGKRRILQAHC